MNITALIKSRRRDVTLTESADRLSVLLVERQLHERCYRWSRVKLYRTYKYNTAIRRLLRQTQHTNHTKLLVKMNNKTNEHIQMPS